MQHLAGLAMLCRQRQLDATQVGQAVTGAAGAAGGGGRSGPLSAAAAAEERQRRARSLVAVLIRASEGVDVVAALPQELGELFQISFLNNTGKSFPGYLRLSTSSYCLPLWLSDTLRNEYFKNYLRAIIFNRAKMISWPPSRRRLATRGRVACSCVVVVRHKFKPIAYRP